MSFFTSLHCHFFSEFLHLHRFSFQTLSLLFSNLDICLYRKKTIPKLFLLTERLLLLLLARPRPNLPDRSPHLRRQRGGEGAAAEALRGLHRRRVGEEEGGQGDREVPGVQVRENILPYGKIHNIRGKVLRRARNLREFEPFG